MIVVAEPDSLIPSKCFSIRVKLTDFLFFFFNAGAHLKGALKEQATAAIDTDLIFPPEILLLDPNLNSIFKIKRARFDKRTSSAVWKTPPSKLVF